MYDMRRDMTQDSFGTVFIPMKKRDGHLIERLAITTSRIVLEKRSCNRMKFHLERKD